jgi:hypothetical protein
MPLVGRFGSLAGLGSLILPGGAMESIATVTVGSGGAANMEFTSIPGTYQHLQIRMLQKFTTTSGTISNGRARFNSDTGNNYARHLLYGDGGGAYADAGASIAYAYIGWPTDSNAARADRFSVSIIDILDYASTSKTKTVRTFHGSDYNGSGYVGVSSALWNSTSAVTTITLTSDTGNWAQHSTAALYGLRAP